MPPKQCNIPDASLNRIYTVSQCVKAALTMLSVSSNSYFPVGLPRSLSSWHNSKSSVVLMSGISSVARVLVELSLRAESTISLTEAMVVACGTVNMMVVL